MAITSRYPRLTACLLSTVSCAALTLAAIPEAAAAWTITNLGTLGGDYSIATDINNFGQVVGYSQKPPHLHNGVDMVSFEHAFISAPNGGALTDLGPSIDDVSRVAGVNNAGQAVGQIILGGSLNVALVTGPNGAPLPSGPFNSPYQGSLSGATFLVARDINNSGQVLGYDVFGNSSFLTKPDGVTLVNFPYALVNRVNDAGQVVYNGLDNRGYLWSESEGARALAPDASFSTAVDINNLGQVVGRIGNSGYITAPNGGAITILSTLGGDYCEPLGINNLGQVIGLSKTSSGLLHAFVTGPGGGPLTDLETLDDVVKAGWSDLTVAAINDLGQIAGTGFIDGQQRAFFLSPVPEPSASVLMLGGLLVLQNLARRRQIRETTAATLHVKAKAAPALNAFFLN